MSIRAIHQLPSFNTKPTALSPYKYALISNISHIGYNWYNNIFLYFFQVYKKYLTLMVLFSTTLQLLQITEFLLNKPFQGICNSI